MLCTSGKNSWQFANFVFRFALPRILCQISFWTIISGILASTSFAQTEKGEESTTFLVVRHAEREGNQDKLSEAGVQRAQSLAMLGRILNVQAVYSTDTKRTKGTAQPLATAAGLKVETYGRLSKAWIDSLKQKHSGQVVLIVGHSNTAGVIAGLIAGENPYKIKHDEYDALFLVQVSEMKKSALRMRFGKSSKYASSADPDEMGIDEPKAASSVK